jgi:flagellar hook-basal body complex protein FliE
MEPSAINSEGVRALTSSRGAAQLGQAAGEPGFKDMLEHYLQGVNALQVEADKAVRNLVAGKTDNFHQVIVAMSEADLSFRLMMQMRNKLEEAYKEIMRMQV